MITNWIPELDEAEQHDLLVAILETLPEPEEYTSFEKDNGPEAFIEIVYDQMDIIDKVRSQPA